MKPVTPLTNALSNASSRSDWFCMSWVLARISFAGWITCVAFLALLANCNLSEKPQALASLRAVGSTSSSAPVAMMLPLAPAVLVTDELGKPVQGVLVMWQVTAGGGSVANDSSRTNSSGLAASGGWRLGTVVGEQKLVASVLGLPSVTFTAQAVAGLPSRIVKITGDGQRGRIGVALPVSPGIRVLDVFGNPVGNVAITFTPGPGSGIVSPQTVLTDALSGAAFLSSWTLGDSAMQSLVATAGAGITTEFTATVVVSNFDITVRYVGVQPSARQKVLIDSAIVRWRSVIVGNSGTSRIVAAAGACGRDWLPAIDTTISNLLIYARITPIDGVDGVLGNASACAFHATSGLTALGTMLFDSEDLDRLDVASQANDLVTHEIGHVLGFGTLWSARRLLDTTIASDPIFTGQGAREQFLAVGGNRYAGRAVPIANDEGLTTGLIHWREAVFGNELMTGFLNPGINPLSRVTVGSLADIGYLVTYAGAESYTLLSPFTANAPGNILSRGIALGNDVFHPRASSGVRVYPAHVTPLP